MSGEPNNAWPDRIWLSGEGYSKSRTTHHDQGAVAYVRADAYDELLEWANAMIIGGEVCPCSLPDKVKDQP